MANKPDGESFADMFTRLGNDLKMPKVDVDAILNHHRKNLDALEKSARAASAGMSSIFEKQREALQAALADITDMTRSLRASGNPQELMTKQADFARKAFEAAVKNAGEVAELARKSGSESIEVLRSRVREALDEVRTGQDPAKK